MNPFEGISLAGFAAAYPKNPVVKKLRRQLRLPSYAGLIDQRRARSTKTLVGLYRSVESGLEADPEFPYSTVCEEHGSIVSHATLDAARRSMPRPDEWCDDCRGDSDDSQK